MAITISYPGVYIQEIPSGVKTIPSVPTSADPGVVQGLRVPPHEQPPINVTPGQGLGPSGYAIDWHEIVHQRAKATRPW